MSREYKDRFVLWISDTYEWVEMSKSQEVWIILDFIIFIEINFNVMRFSSFDNNIVWNRACVMEFPLDVI